MSAERSDEMWCSTGVEADDSDLEGLFTMLDAAWVLLASVSACIA